MNEGSKISKEGSNRAKIQESRPDPLDLLLRWQVTITYNNCMLKSSIQLNSNDRS